jgi:hypothetical protein
MWTLTGLGKVSRQNIRISSKESFGYHELKEE